MLDQYLKARIKDNAIAIAFELEKREIPVPKEFVDVCIEHVNVYMHCLGKRDVENAISMADFWAPYLKNKEEYYKLIIEVLYCLYRIQSCALNNNPESGRLFIGSRVEILPNGLGSREKNLKRTYVGVGSRKVIIIR